MPLYRHNKVMVNHEEWRWNTAKAKREEKSETKKLETR